MLLTHFLPSLSKVVSRNVLLDWKGKHTTERRAK